MQTLAKNHPPDLSIVVPTYNAENHVGELIECVIRQKYENWELILVDDGSTDATPELIKQYSNTDERIKYKSRDRSPKGAQTCRNIGLDHSTGKYIVFFDADDLISDGCLMQRVSFMNSNKSVDIGIFPAETFGEKKGEAKKYGIKSSDDQLRSFLTAKYEFTVWTNIYRKDAIKGIRWDENVSVLQDLDFNITSLHKGLNYSFCKDAEVDYFYRISNGNKNISADFISPEKNRSTIYLFGKIFSMLEMRGDFPERKDEFFWFVALHFYRLCIGGQGWGTKKYIKFCGEKYGPYCETSFKIIYLFAKNIQSVRTRGYVVKSLVAAAFPVYASSKFLEKINGTLKRRIFCKTFPA